MAKAKKSEDKPTKKPASAPGKPAGKTAGAKGHAKKAPGAGAASQASHAPPIDTNLAASAAASMILNRAVGGSGAAPPAGAGPQPAKKESASFKQLKQNIAKPAASGPGGILSNATTQKKAGNLPFGGGQQKGHQQVFGADVNRAGVPRRTGGG